MKKSVDRYRLPLGTVIDKQKDMPLAARSLMKSLYLSHPMIQAAIRDLGMATAEAINAAEHLREIGALRIVVADPDADEDLVYRIEVDESRMAMMVGAA